ncbi:MAG: hypothetical protein VZR53_01520 [Prevotella sp.]|nr:hypothetical protein [Prevotella sp.]
MTHKDIYTKFMIEYDKANVTSSYPSLTEYEVATVLDKAYNALIAQKVTGNNVRRSSVESDVKSISDLQPLLMHSHPVFQDFDADSTEVAVNIATFNIPKEFLYFVQLYLIQKVKGSDSTGLNVNEDAIYSDPNTDFEHNYPDFEMPQTDVTDDHIYTPIKATASQNPMDTKKYRRVPVRLVPHQVAEKFFATSYNIPWVKIPVCYLENGKAYVVYDLMNPPYVSPGAAAHFVFIKKPNKFVKDLNSTVFNNATDVSFFDCPDTNSEEVKQLYQFECDDTVAEELISLAVAFALENVESQRLNSKLNMRGLEA